MDSVKTLVHAFISSCLDYCNSLLVAAADCVIWKLQGVQNASAQLITGTRKLHYTNPSGFALASGSPADKIQDPDTEVSAGPSTPVSGWALPTGGWACWTSASEVGCLRQAECATDSHNHRSQELCCFRSRHLEQPTNWPAYFVTVDGNLHDTWRHTCSALNDICLQCVWVFLRLRCL